MMHLKQQCSRAYPIQKSNNSLRSYFSFIELINTKLFQISSFNVQIKSSCDNWSIGFSFFNIIFNKISNTAEYGNQLNEFDPFFNFRATEYIVENGFSEYFEWVDDKSWYDQKTWGISEGAMEEMFLQLLKPCFIVQQL